VERNFEGFWPIESRENPKKKARFFLGIIPRLSPDAFASGSASFGCRARSIMAASNIP
jgi:hypothetical protein